MSSNGGLSASSIVFFLLLNALCDIKMEKVMFSHICGTYLQGTVMNFYSSFICLFSIIHFIFYLVVVTTSVKASWGRLCVDCYWSHSPGAHCGSLAVLYLCLKDLCGWLGAPLQSDLQWLKSENHWALHCVEPGYSVIHAPGCWEVGHLCPIMRL